MKAALFHAVGDPLSIQEVDDPTPGPGELVVRVRGCGICGSDLHISSFPPGLPANTIMGHEFSGEVVELGRDAGDFRVGDRVCALPFIGCGRCAGCLSGDAMTCPTIQTTGLGQIPGAYAEYVRVGSNETLRLPEEVDFECGAMVEPLSVGLHAVMRAEIRAGDAVLVIGAGPIGLATAQWARFFGARNVVVSEKAARRLELADAFGATAAIDASREDVSEAFVREVGKAPDVIFECVGVPGLIQHCIDLAPPRARVVVVGVCVQPDTIMPFAAIIKELRVDFVVGYRKQDFELTLEMLARGRIPGREMITDRVDLAALPAAFEALKRPSTQCKVMLEP